MAITLADFNKIWASSSPLTPYSFTDNNYKQGWNFIGSTPPARQMWDFLQKNNDEKMQYIVNDICVPTEIDETSASGDYYSYPVPNGKVFANFKTLWGKTIAWNQILDHSATTETKNTIIFTNNNDGSWTVSGTSSSTTTKLVTSSFTAIILNHKYLCRGSFVETNYFGLFITNENKYDNGKGVIFTATANSAGVMIYVNGGTPMSNVIFKPQLFDLTLMFGAGNEPTTVAEFEAMFPASYYAYNEGTLLSAGIKEVIAKDSSNNVVATMPIPSAVQSLEGYGWSAGSVYNYIDFARKKFVKHVAGVDLGTLTWNVQAELYRIYSVSLQGVAKESTSDGAVANIISDSFLPTTINNVSSGTSGVAFSTSALLCVGVGSNDSTTLNNLKNSLSGKMLYYELATPIETDISSILGAVGIACGNTLTFDYDDDYKLPVPVSMDLIDNTYGMMTAQDKAKLDVVYDYIQRVSGN